MWRIAPLAGLVATLAFFPSSTTGEVPQTDAVTFSEDVAPIFFERCVHCHRPGEIAPMSLMTYQAARPWARSIRQEVITRRMPPWRADPHYGDFQNEMLLTEAELRTIVAWVDGGAPEGDPANMPEPPRFTEGWQIGTPDLILEMEAPFTVAAEGEIPYITVSSGYTFTEDTYVQAIEVRPGNRRVVHHAVASVATAGNRPRADDEYLHLYSPGMEAMVFRPGYGKVIRAGSTINFSMHYNAVGEEQVDQSRIGFVFSKERPHTLVNTTIIANNAVEIPPMVNNHETIAAFRFPSNSRIHGLRPHLHLRGKTATASLIHPDGARRVMLHVPDWSDSWQNYYVLSEPARVPQNAFLELVVNFDNSPANPVNPDPSKTVAWGQQVWDEMHSIYMTWTEENEQNRNDNAPIQIPVNQIFTTGVLDTRE